MSRRVPIVAVCLFICFMLNLPVVKAETVPDTIYPRASQQPDNTIHYVDMEKTDYSLKDLFMIESLQGIVNREKPRIWVLKNPIHIYDAGPGFDPASVMVDRSFWFNQISGYAKVQHTNPKELVQAFAGSLSGVILYDANLLNTTTGYNGNLGSFNYVTNDNSDLAEPNKSFQPSADTVAKLNVTAMLCAKYNAIALTADQLNDLTLHYGVELPVLVDTATIDLSTWEKSYDYAMNNLSSDMRTDIMANNPNFSLAMFDYLIANKIFMFNMKGNPSTGTGLTSSEKALTDTVVDRTEPVTPVVGVWGGSTDEDTFGKYLNKKGKFVLVMSESFNMSWTSGLPSNLPAASETNRNLVYDPAKIYISFTETDGDTLLFPHLKFPTWFQLPNRESYPIGWEIPSTINEIDPLAGNYFAQHIGKNNYVNPVTGVGYIKYPMPDPYKDLFYEKTERYMQDMKYRLIRTMNYDQIEASAYTDIPSVEGIFAGYGGMDPGRPSVEQNAETNFSYLNKPIFINYSFFDRELIRSYDKPGPAFFSVAAQYVNTTLLIDFIDSLPSRFVVVSPGELVDLYKQYAETVFSDVSQAGYRAKFSHDESGFIEENNGTYIADGNHRVADGNQSVTYKFDLADDLTSSQVVLDLANNYVVEASKNKTDWVVVGKASADIHDASNRGKVTIDLSGYLLDNPSKIVYVKLSDGSPADGWGPSLFSVSLNGGEVPEEIPVEEDKTFLKAGSYLGVGDYLASSSGSCFLYMQSDGNLVLYGGSNPSHNTGMIWQSNTAGTPGDYFAIMQGDGNFVIYKGTGPSDNKGFVWSTGTGGNGVSFLYVQDDLRVFIYNGSDPSHNLGPIWSTPVPPDVTAPNWGESPTLSVTEVGEHQVTLTWPAASDHVGVTEYKIAWGQNQNVTVPGNVHSATITELQTGTAYTFTVQAGDSAGNWSVDGPNVIVTTASPPSGPILVTSLAISGPDNIIAKKDEVVFRAIVEPTDAALQTVRWAVYNVDGSKTKIATINQDGTLKPNKHGTVKIVATAMDGSGVTAAKILTIIKKKQK
ncbi:fibronectin type III domain-containing protein [Cohnella silvisoli]|uniref:GxGYxYP family putative glycoside hydrolase n=1 Tax=Cohnella silvisoli TaxID=2873699 RepID=A0ABV1KWL5_9BACL|nr:fibronectin type III domain-containing protein [Cohnella silvisoli]MCD9023770.1 fibronectin type III domain-containing protein [Cohnella silvisoli]